MRGRCQKLFPTIKGSSGFTLIEMLIVIIILGILAMVIIPQISVSTEDAKVSTLKTNLTGIRSAIEIYYAQHNMTYPGVKKTDGTETLIIDAGESATAFIAQLTQYTDAKGHVSASADAANYPFGPYIKGGALPANPFTTSATDAVNVVCELSTTVKITDARTLSGTVGWKFLRSLGILHANDSLPHSLY